MRQSDCRRHPQSAYQKVEIAITPTRQSACVYCAIEIHIPQLVDYLRTNQLRFFSYVLYVCKETVLRHPFLNDFFLGGKNYAHTSLVVSTAMKKDVNADGKIKNVRSSPDTGFNHLIDLLNILPMFLFKFVLFVASTMDKLGILPYGLIEADPLHSSAVIANLEASKAMRFSIICMNGKPGHFLLPSEDSAKMEMLPSTLRLMCVFRKISNFSMH